MTALERVMQLKKRGMSDQEIISSLKQEGITPMEINDALNQSKIKDAVTSENQSEDMVPSMMESPQAPSPNQSEQEVYNPQPPQPSAGGEYAPSSQPNYQLSYAPQYPESYSAQPQEEYYEEQYDPNQYAGGGGGYSSDTMIEIAEQVFSEKMKKMEKQVKELEEFKTIYSTKIDEINERLKRMEKYFDKMQLEILEKVGEYGKGLNSIKKEMNMIEDSFSKIMKEK
jgi:hypothetical protein